MLLRIRSTHTQLGANSRVHKLLIGLFSKLPIFGGLSGDFQSSNYKPETYPPLPQTSWNCTDIWVQGGAEQGDKKEERSRVCPCCLGTTVSLIKEGHSLLLVFSVPTGSYCCCGHCQEISCILLILY